MRAEFDSAANALSIDLIEADRWDGVEEVDENFCTVAFARERPANVELLSPADHLELLGEVASKHQLDPVALEAAARSALAAPDHAVTIEVHALA